jgi:hypothetical protein
MIRTSEIKIGFNAVMEHAKPTHEALNIMARLQVSDMESAKVENERKSHTVRESQSHSGRNKSDRLEKETEAGTGDRKLKSSQSFSILA